MYLLVLASSLAFTAPQSAPPNRVPHVQPLSRLMVPIDAISTPAAKPSYRVEGFLNPEMAFDEVMPSWNAKYGSGQLHLEIQIAGDGFTTEWIDIAADGAKSTGGLATVSDGIIHLKRLGTKLSYRGTFTPDKPRPRILNLLTFNLANLQYFGPSPAARKMPAWGRSLPDNPLPPKAWDLEDRPMAWLLQQSAPALDPAVVKAQASIDHPFTHRSTMENLAFLASLGNLIAYRSRFVGMDDLELWIAWTLPVLCYVKPTEQSAMEEWLLVGFTVTGDPIVIKPDGGKGTVPRETFDNAWLRCYRTVAIAHSTAVYTPEDRKSIWPHGHLKGSTERLGD